MLTLQASHTLTLDADAAPAPVRGYFHAWEDYALFVLFVLFTCVSPAPLVYSA